MENDSVLERSEVGTQRRENVILELEKECGSSDAPCPLSPTSSANRTVAGASTIASRMRYAHPEETLVFLDWDDTLFPTTALFDCWGLSSRMDSDVLNLSEEQERQLSSWRKALYEHLSVLCSLSSRIVVVTNSKRPWVHDCMKRFAPELLSLFEKNEVQVVYAREALSKAKRNRARPVMYDTWESECSMEEFEEQQTLAKFLAMKKATYEFYSRYPGQSWKNILSFGDMQYEHDALQEVTFTRESPKREKVRTKVFTLQKRASVSQMAMILTLRKMWLPVFVHFDGDIDLDLSKNHDSRLHTIATALQMPEIEDLLHVPDFPIIGEPGQDAPLLDSEDFPVGIAKLIDDATVLVHNIVTE